MKNMEHGQLMWFVLQKQCQTIHLAILQIEWLMAHLADKNYKHLQLLLTVWIFLFCLRRSSVPIFSFCVMIDDLASKSCRKNYTSYQRWKKHWKKLKTITLLFLYRIALWIWLIGWLATKPKINCNSINLLIVLKAICGFPLYRWNWSDFDYKFWIIL